MPRFLFLVDRQLPYLHEYLRDEFGAERDVTVIIDRRIGERRQRPRSGTPSLERRRAERRQNARIDDQLRAVGYAFVRLD